MKKILLLRVSSLLILLGFSQGINGQSFHDIKDNQPTSQTPDNMGRPEMDISQLPLEFKPFTKIKGKQARNKSALGYSDSLLTTLVGGNNFNGNMFTVIAKNDIEIYRFKQNFVGTGVFTFRIYYKTGSFIGSDLSVADWTFLEEATFNVTNGDIFEIPIDVNLSINTGDSISFYLTTLGLGQMVDYTNGSNPTAVFVEDDNIKITEGYGNAYPFAGTFSSRIWNGEILYTKETPMTVAKSSVTPESCLGSANGLLSVVTTGGAEPYKFSLDGITYKFGASFTGLAAGKYVVYAKDANGVIAVTDSITVASPTAISAYILTVDHVTCFNGNDGGATINIQGGTPPYTYQLGGITTVGYSIQQSKAGTFSPTITDANGCVLVMDLLTINQPAAYSLSVSATDFPTCGDGLSGAISATAEGGTPPYTYYINGETNGASGEISGLGIGTHLVTVVDAEGCELVANPITFTGPSLIGVGSVVVSNALCNGGTGSITITASGDVTGVQYALGAGAFQSSNIFTGVAAGTQLVRVKNSFACEASATATITEPMAMQLSAKISDYKSCTGNALAAITLKALGGQPPYAYRKGSGGFQSSNVFEGLDEGSYSFTVIDANGCSARVFNVTVDSYEPLVMTAFAEGQNNCVGNKNGRVVGVANGGQAPFSYFLSGVGTQTTGVFNNLASGSYVITITDALQCTVQSDTLTIAVPVAMDGGLVILNGLDCGDDNDGILQALASGGVSPYTYSLDGITFTPESVFTNRAAGSYRAYVKDVNGCLFVSEGLSLISPALMTISAQVNGVGCNGDATGSIIVNVTGGNPPYQYATSSQGPWGSDKELAGLSAGAQHIFVRSANACVQFYGIVDVPEPVVLSLTATTTPELVYKDGGIQMKATGGTGPYQYYYYAFSIWNSSLNPSVNWLSAGTYLISITDNEGCTDTTTAIVYSEVGVEELEEFKVKLYPVPSTGAVNLEMNDTPLKLEVLNNLGAVMYIQTEFNSDKVQLDLSNLAKGMYQIRVSSQLNTKVLPLLLQ